MTSRQIQLAGIFAISGMMLVIATHVIRPLLGTFSQGFVFLLGVLPNFGAGLSLPFVIFILLIRFWQVQFRSVNLLAVFIFSLTITFLGLTAWEVIQYRMWGFPMDENDIFATGLSMLGAASGYFVITHILKS